MLTANNDQWLPGCKDQVVSAGGSQCIHCYSRKVVDVLGRLPLPGTTGGYGASSECVDRVIAAPSSTRPQVQRHSCAAQLSCGL